MSLWVRIPLSPPSKKPRVSGLFAYFGLVAPAKSCGKNTRYLGTFENARKTTSLFISLFGQKIFRLLDDFVKVVIYQNIHFFTLSAKSFLVYTFHSCVGFPPSALHCVLIGDI